MAKAGHSFKEFFKLPTGQPGCCSRLPLGSLGCPKKSGENLVNI